MKTLKDFADRKLNHQELNKLHGGSNICGPLEKEFVCDFSIDGVKYSSGGHACAKSPEDAQNKIVGYYKTYLPGYKYEAKCVELPSIA